MGLGGLENLQFQPYFFSKVFGAAKILGMKTTAHCGEITDCNYIKDGLLYLELDRIDHGCSIYQDYKLLKYVQLHGIPITMCPISNVKLGVYKSLKEHPIKFYLDMGLNVSINSDDPTYLGGGLVENYFQVTEALDLTEENILQLVKNSFEGSFLSDNKKHKYLELIEETYNKIA